MIFDELLTQETDRDNIGGQAFGTEHLHKPFDVAVNTTKTELLY